MPTTIDESMSQAREARTLTQADIQTIIQDGIQAGSILYWASLAPSQTTTERILLGSYLPLLPGVVVLPGEFLRIHLLLYLLACRYAQMRSDFKRKVIERNCRSSSETYLFYLLFVRFYY